MSSRIQTMAVADLVEYKAHFRAPWRPGFVAEVEAHRVVMEDAFTGRRSVIQLGKKGKVRGLSGQKLVDTVAAVQRHQAQRAHAALPTLQPVLVGVGGQPRAVPRPRRPARSRRYLAEEGPCHESRGDVQPRLVSTAFTLSETSSSTRPTSARRAGRIWRSPMPSSSDRLRVYGTSGGALRPLLGTAHVETAPSGQTLLRIELLALPLDGKLELSLKDVLVLAEDIGPGGGSSC